MAIDAAAERRRELALWLMAFTVVAWIPGGLSRFVFAKLLVTVIACGLGATVPARGRLPRLVVWPLGAGAALFVVAALLSETSWSSLVGRWPRYEGLPTLAVYGAAAWLGSRLIGTDRDLAGLVRPVAAASVALGVLVVAEAVGFSPLGPAEVSRTGSVMGNATDLGLVAMMFALILVRPTWERPSELTVAGLGFAGVTVAMSGSRAALGLTVIGLVVLAVISQRRLLAPLLGGAAGVVALALVVPATRERLLDSETVRGRWELWRIGSRMIADHPITGVGPSRFVDAIGTYETPRWVEVGGTTPPVDSPHNWLLQVWLGGGLPLLVCALALVGVTSVLGWRAIQSRPALAGVFVAVGCYGAAMLTGFTNPTSTCLAAFMAGILLARPVATPEPVWIRPVTVGAAGLAAAVLAAGCVSEIYLRSGFTAAAAVQPSQALSGFANADRLRWWDPDASMLSAQALAGMADAGTGDDHVVSRGRSYAEASLAATPQSFQSLTALAVLLGSAGDSAGDRDRAAEIWEQLRALFPQREVTSLDQH